MNEYKREKDIIDSVESAERLLEKDILSRVDWDDPLDVALFKRETRAINRLKELNKLVPDRICPRCKICKPNTASWIINKKGTEAICRSCFHLGLPDERVDKITIRRKIFRKPEIRYVLDSFALSSAREELGLTKKQFAFKANWSYPYQRKLETGRVLTISEDVALVIMNIFYEYEKKTLDTI